MHADLQQVASLVNFLDVFVGKDAAGSLQLALSLSGSSGDDGLMQAGHKHIQSYSELTRENTETHFCHLFVSKELNERVPSKDK